MREAGYAQVAGVDHPAMRARLAKIAMPPEPADIDAPTDRAGADRLDRATNLVPTDAREKEVRPLSFDSATLTVAHSAFVGADADFVRRRLQYFVLMSSGGPPARATRTARILPSPPPIQAVKCHTNVLASRGWKEDSPTLIGLQQAVGTLGRECLSRERGELTQVTVAM